MCILCVTRTLRSIRELCVGRGTKGIELLVKGKEREGGKEGERRGGERALLYNYVHVCTI